MSAPDGKSDNRYQLEFTIFMFYFCSLSWPFILLRTDNASRIGNSNYFAQTLYNKYFPLDYSWECCGTHMNTTAIFDYRLVRTKTKKEKYLPIYISQRVNVSSIFHFPFFLLFTNTIYWPFVNNIDRKTKKSQNGTKICHHSLPKMKPNFLFIVQKKKKTEKKNTTSIWIWFCVLTAPFENRKCS